MRDRSLEIIDNFFKKEAKEKRLKKQKAKYTNLSSPKNRKKKLQKKKNKSFEVR